MAAWSYTRMTQGWMTSFSFYNHPSHIPPPPKQPPPPPTTLLPSNSARLFSSGLPLWSAVISSHITWSPFFCWILSFWFLPHYYTRFIMRNKKTAPRSYMAGDLNFSKRHQSPIWYFADPS
jgi:hypothetical protein